MILFYNLPVFLSQKFLIHGATGILVNRDVFEKVGGFDQEIKLAEDHYFVRRAAKLASYGIIRGTGPLISDRRLRRDGWLITYLKYIFCELHMILIGPVKSDIFHYRFNHYLHKKRNKVK